MSQIIIPILKSKMPRKTSEVVQVSTSSEFDKGRLSFWFGIIAWIAIGSLLLAGCASKEPDANTLLIQDLTRKLVAIEQNQHTMQQKIAMLTERSHFPVGVAAIAVDRHTGRVSALNNNNASMGTDALYEQAMGLYRAGNVASAIPLLEQYLIDAPNGSKAILAQYWLGDAYYYQRDFDMASHYLGIFLKNAPDSDKSSRALTKLVDALQTVGRHQEAAILAEQGASAIMRHE